MVAVVAESQVRHQVSSFFYLTVKGHSTDRRRGISNSWTPHDPDPVIALLASWMPILPQFIQDNILDQLVLPKVSQAIAEWVAPKRKSKAGSSVALHEIFLPWMGILDQDDQRMEGLVEEAKRKMKAFLKVWRVRDGVPASLDVWKKVRLLGRASPTLESF